MLDDHGIIRELRIKINPCMSPTPFHALPQQAVSAPPPSLEG